MNSTTQSAVDVSVIVPARNEEELLGRCLRSLISQTGVSFEVILVNDHSSDRTREIASSVPGVLVIDAPPLPEGWTGKNHALWCGVQHARGAWLLFTDADTFHHPGSLRASLVDSQTGGAALVSYSPEQEVVGFWQHAVMPLIFSELAKTYRPAEVSDPESDAAAANGQYVLVTREAYEAIGGHAAVAGEILEDVELARLIKSSGRRILFRYGEGRVSTRMYRTLGEMVEGWSKNLALLFARPRLLAVERALEMLLMVASPVGTILLLYFGWNVRALIMLLVAAIVWSRFDQRVQKAHFSDHENLMAIAGLPLFAYLLWRSSLLHERGEITWKGRVYSGSESVTDHAESTIETARSRAAG